MTTPFFAPERYETPDFVLRGYRVGDGALYAAAYTSSYDHLRSSVPFIKPEMTMEEGEEQIRKAAADYLSNTQFRLGIFSPDGSQLWGNTGFQLWGRPFTHGTAEVGMWIRADQSGKGLGVAVLKALIEWAFTEWTWDRLQWRCSLHNVPSQRTAEKAGMLLEGTHRLMLPNPQGTGKEDIRCYAMVKEEWIEANGKVQSAKYG